MLVGVTGAKDCYRLADALHEAGQRGLRRELDKASREAGRILADEVVKHAGDYIPQHFEARWDQAMEAKVEVELRRGRRITVRFYATGKKERRDIRAINRGILRKPVYGRMRRLRAGGRYVPPAHQERIVGDHYLNPWVAQSIRPGLVDEPAQRAMPQAVKKIDDAVKRVVDKIGRS